MEKTNLYQVITDKFIEALKGGRIPWRKPWGGQNSNYSYLNRMLIQMQAEERYSKTMEAEAAEAMVEKVCAGRFYTFNAIQKMQGAKVNTGAKSYMVTFFTFYQPKDENGEPAMITNSRGELVPKLFPLLKYYRIFSEYDCTGIPEGAKAKNAILPLDAAEEIISDYVRRNKPLRLCICNSNRAYYSPTSDRIVLPLMEQYKDRNEFYSTAFHEITHSTGHQSRLDRLANGAAAAFGGEDYSREELVAEMGAAMCLGRLGVDSSKTFRNSVAYIQGWLQALRNDNRMIFWAASRAEAAVKYIFNDKDNERRV